MLSVSIDDVSFVGDTCGKESQCYAKQVLLEWAKRIPEELLWLMLKRQNFTTCFCQDLMMSTGRALDWESRILGSRTITITVWMKYFYHILLNIHAFASVSVIISLSGHFWYLSLFRYFNFFSSLFNSMFSFIKFYKWKQSNSVFQTLKISKYKPSFSFFLGYRGSLDSTRWPSRLASFSTGF